MLVVDIDSDVAKAAEAYGLLDWCGDAYELTPKGFFTLLRWCDVVVERCGTK